MVFAERRSPLNQKWRSSAFAVASSMAFIVISAYCRGCALTHQTGVCKLGNAANKENVDESRFRQNYFLGACRWRALTCSGVRQEAAAGRRDADTDSSRCGAADAAAAATAAATRASAGADRNSGTADARRTVCKLD